jgi:hypothetical protein
VTGRRLLLAVSGLIVWSSGLVALYGGMTLGCEAGLHRHPMLGTNLLTLLLAAVLLVHLGLLVALQWYAWVAWQRRRGTGDAAAFLASLTLLVTAVAVVGMVAVGLPVIMVPPCA